jgi:hypothetical protein
MLPKISLAIFGAGSPAFRLPRTSLLFSQSNRWSFISIVILPYLASVAGGIIAIVPVLPMMAQHY